AGAGGGRGGDAEADGCLLAPARRTDREAGADDLVLSEGEDRRAVEGAVGGGQVGWEAVVVPEGDSVAEARDRWPVLAEFDEEVVGRSRLTREEDRCGPGAARDRGVGAVRLQQDGRL